MLFYEILCIAEKIATTAKMTERQQPVQKQKEFRQCRQRNTIQFQKSTYKLRPIVADSQQKGAPHPDATNSINVVHFPNTNKDNPK